METLQEKSLKFNSNMVVSNDGGQLSNDAGLLLLFELAISFIVMQGYRYDRLFILFQNKTSCVLKISQV